MYSAKAERLLERYGWERVINLFSRSKANDPVMLCSDPDHALAIGHYAERQQVDVKATDLGGLVDVLHRTEAAQEYDLDSLTVERTTADRSELCPVCGDIFSNETAVRFWQGNLLRHRRERVAPVHIHDRCAPELADVIDDYMKDYADELLADAI